MLNRCYQQITSAAINPAPTQKAAPHPQGWKILNFKYPVVLEEPVKTIKL